MNDWVNQTYVTLRILPGHIAHLVLPGLPHGLDLFAGHCFPFSNRLSGGWSPSNRLNKTEAALHELHNVLR